MFAPYWRARWAVCFAVLAVVGVEVSAADRTPDFGYTESHVFTLEKRGGGYRLSEEVDVSIRYLTSRSTDVRSFPVAESFYAPVSRLTAQLDGKKLGRDEVYEEAIEWRDVFLSGGRVHRIAPERSPEVGGELAYSYRREYSEPAYFPVLRVPNLDEVLRYVIEVKHPEGVVVDPVVFAPRETPYTVQQSDRSTRVVFESLGGVADVPYFAHNGEQAAVLVQVRDASGPLTPTAPDDFAGWYTGLVASASGPGSAELAALASSLQRDTPEETVSAIHDHVRSTIRYIADARDAGAFVPRAPDLVLTNQYGDCKDRAFLVRELARQLGIDVDIVLISTQPEADFESVHVGLFNHVINAYDAEDGSRTYFDPTHPYLAYGDIPDSDVDGQALVLTDSGAQRLRVPAQDLGPALEMHIGALDLDAAENAIVHITVRGDLLGILRGVESRDGDQEEGNALSSIVGELFYKVRLMRGVRLTDSPRERTYSAEADLSQFVIASPTKRYVPLTPFRAVPSEIETRTDDALPITLGMRPNLKLTMNAAPGSWAPDSSAVQWGTEEGPAHFRASARVTEDGGTSVTYEFRQRTRQLEGEARAAYIDLATRYLDAKREVFTFRTSTPD